MRNDFDAGKSITRAIVRALNIETFLGPEIASSRQASAISGPKKVEQLKKLRIISGSTTLTILLSQAILILCPCPFKKNFQRLFSLTPRTFIIILDSLMI